MSRTVLFAVILLVLTVDCIAPPVFGQQAAATRIMGGSGGDNFANLRPPTGARVVEVHIRSGDYIDSVQMVYALPDGSTKAGPRHGGSRGRSNRFRLDADEYITGISGRYADLIDSMRIHTNKRTSQLFGGRGGERDYLIEVPQGNQAVGFIGRAGDYVDAIGLAYAPISARITQTQIAGGRGGKSFVDREIPQRARIGEVRIRTGDLVDSIQVVYLLADGRTYEGDRHGGRGGRRHSFRLDPDEYITGISGRHGDHIDSIRIHTNKRTSPLFGGRGGNRNYRIDVPTGNRALGFAGRAGEFLDAIGLTYKPIERRSRRRRYRP